MDDNSLTKKIADSYELANNVLEHIPNPLVSIRTSAYNHGPYIKQCIEGVLMQRTNFPFEYIIGEDFSNDETREIVFEYAKKYPNIIRVITADYNVGSRANGRRCIQACRGKYMAICEGDDYWIDPLKLQKQVDFLEKHPEYVMSHTSIQYYFQNQKLFVKSKDAEINAHLNDDVHAEDILFSDRYRIQTVTVVYRKDIAELVLSSDSSLYRSGCFLQGDTPLWYGLLQHGKIHFLPEVTAIYRRNDESVTATKDIKKYMRFMLSYAELRMYLVHRDNLSSIEERVDRIYAQILLCYKAFNPNYIPNYQIDVKKYAKSYYYLYRIGILSFFLLAKNFVKTCLRPWKNRMANSI